jgi:hypothetical protein
MAQIAWTEILGKRSGFAQFLHCEHLLHAFQAPLQVTPIPMMGDTARVMAQTTLMMNNTHFTNWTCYRRSRRLLVGLCLFVVSLSPALAQITPTPPAVAPVSLQPIYWQQPLLFIPYQINKELPATRDIAQVQLLVSRTGTGNWMVLQSARPDVQGFSYHAPEDGQYWFALKHLDAKGQTLDGANVVSQLHLVIDTGLPQLSLLADTAGNNQIVIRYEAADPNLNPQSLLIEARPSGGLWTNIPVGLPEVSQPGRLIGTTQWTLPQASGEIEIRGSVADSTAQRGQATTTVSVNGPELTLPAQTSPAPETSPNVAATRSPFATATRDPFQAPAKGAQDWPPNNQILGNQLPVVSQNASPVGPPPLINPYVIAKEDATPRRTQAKFAVDGSENVEAAEPEKYASDLLNGNRSTQDVPLPLPPTEDSEWASAGRSSDGPLLVNARTFDVEYELASVGTWGVAKVELWGTSDDGKTWQSFGADVDNRSPARVTVPHSGTFGFRILVDGANAPTSTPPQAGDKPELVVSVDLDTPTAEIIAVEPGEGNLSDHLRIRWKATDENLESRPVGLFYSSYANGPWSTVAAGLENTGSYLWRIERHVPGRFYLKLEARDTAGNVATYLTPEPIELNRPQPTGTLRNIRPVADVPRVGK